MIKSIALTTTVALFLFGCGGGGDSSTQTSTRGAYNLWEYMTPSSSKNNTFTLTTNSQKSTYNTDYQVKSSRIVHEVADYAPDETTIYEKGDNKIIVTFEKGGKPNGTYSLKLHANINDIVTTRNSSCRLTKHHDTFSIANKTFKDVIEITCGTTPGYYQKGVGEIAQIKEDSSGKNIRVLSQ